jgi:hypothetical protein
MTIVFSSIEFLAELNVGVPLAANAKLVTATAGASAAAQSTVRDHRCGWNMRIPFQLLASNTRTPARARTFPPNACVLRRE